MFRLISLSCWLWPAVVLSALPSGTPPRVTACPYTQQSAASRQLLRRLDYLLAVAVRQAASRSEAQLLLTPTGSRCFAGRNLADAFPTASQVDVQASRHLTHFYARPLGEAGAVEVLEYDSGKAALAAQQTQDSLVSWCRTHSSRQEPCAGIDFYRVVRRQAMLVRFNLPSADPQQRAQLRQVASIVGSRL